MCLTYASDESAAEHIVQTITAEGGEAVAVRAEVGAEQDIVAAFTVADRLCPLRGFGANADVVGAKDPGGRAGCSPRHPHDGGQRDSSILGCREAVRRMSTMHGGKGVSIGLIFTAASRLGSPGEYVGYTASKGAIDTFGVGLAKEVASERIRVNVMRPGIVDTGIHASGRKRGSA